MRSAFHPSDFMLLPTMACQAGCSYCFAQKTGEFMSRDTAEKAIDFIGRIAPAGKNISLTFHGGEPLLAGEAFYAFLLPMLMERFGRRIRLSMQSNLWAMTDSLAELFRKYRVSVGTSLDGPQELCDRQRGAGYYAGTKAGMEILQRHQIRTGIISTLTADSADQAALLFRKSTQPYVLHGAVPLPGADGGKSAVDADGMKRILLDSYQACKEDPAHGRIATIDAMVKGCFQEKGRTCTFMNCLGMFAAIAPDGGIYSCQRFCGEKELCFGNVRNDPDERAIVRSRAYQRLRTLEKSRETACSGCRHWEYCRGGCLFNSVTAETEKDPYCESYQAVFDRIQFDMAREMGASLLHRDDPTPVLAMAGAVPHPYDVRCGRERMRKALEKGKYVTADTGSGLRDPYPEYGLNKLYLHITFDCPLHCSHCYADGGVRKSGELPPARFAEAVREASDCLFRSVVITGGEPLAYKGFRDFCRELAGIDRKGTRLILRSSFGFPVSKWKMKLLCETFDEIVVSVDGSRETHDARRGEGRYDQTVSNLKLAVSCGAAEKLSLAAVLNHAEAKGIPGDAVCGLAKELGISKVSFRPLLPLGRGSGAQQELWQLCSSEQTDLKHFTFRHTCGLGQNLYVEPDGSAYPCYAWCEPEHRLGSLGGESLREILERGTLYEYCQHDVDSNEKCRTCEVRYLCGGICKAWVKDRKNIDSGDFDCTSRKSYFLALTIDEY